MKKQFDKASSLIKSVCAGGVLALGLSMGSAQAASVSLDWTGPGAVTVGNKFSIGLTFDGLTAAAGHSVQMYEFGIKYDTSAFQLVGSTFGTGGYNPLDLPGGKYPFYGEANDSGGLIDIFAMSGSTQAELDVLQSGSFIAFTLEFVALAANPLALIEIDALSPFLIGGSDGNDLTLASGLPQHFITVNERAAPGVVPEPGMAYLFGIGLLGVWFGRRRMNAA